jgi:outer membrane protein assembly factor BamB
MMNKEEKLKLSKNVAVVAGIFSIAVALLLLLNFFQMTRSKPLDSEALAVLVKQLSQDKDNDGLKAEIRNFDLLARKAYFNTQWQIKTGGIMLLAGAIVLILALRSYYGLKSKITEPITEGENEIVNRALAQKWVVIAGSLIFIGGIGASYLTVDYLQKYQVDEKNLGKETANSSGKIEIVEVGSSQTAQKPVAVKSDSLVKKDSAVVAPVASAPVEIKLPGSEAVKSNSPSFRGPFGLGISYHKNVPVDFDLASGKNILWKAQIPLSGFNSPVVWGNKVFLSGGNVQKREIYCFEGSSGKLLWNQPVDKIQGSAGMPKVSDDTGLAPSTLTTDGNMVYGIFANGDVICFDMTGKRIWARNIGLPDNHYGHASSLIMWKDKIYVQYDNNKTHKLIALNNMTGETKWKTDRKVKISWATPILANIGGKYQVVLTADPLVAGYDAETGKELWSVNCMSGEVGSSPAYGSGYVFAANEYAKLAAIDPASSKVVWESTEYLPEVASLVSSNGLLFLGTSYGVLVCYDAKTGNKYWEKEDGPGFYSSPVVNNGKLYTIDTNGRMRVYEVSKEQKLLGESNFGEKMVTTPAFAEGRMYVRGSKYLYCIGNK